MGVVVVIVLGGSTRRVITHDARKEVSKAKYESRIPQLFGMSVQSSCWGRGRNEALGRTDFEMTICSNHR